MNSQSILARVMIGAGQVRKIEIYIARNKLATFHIGRSHHGSRAYKRGSRYNADPYSFCRTDNYEDVESDDSSPYELHLRGGVGAYLLLSSARAGDLYSDVMSKGPFHTDGSLLQVIRYPKDSVHSLSTHHVNQAKRTTTQESISQTVSANRQFWKEVHSRESLPVKDIIYGNKCGLKYSSLSNALGREERDGRP